MAQHWRRVLYPHSPFGLVARVPATHSEEEEEEEEEEEDDLFVFNDTIEGPSE